MFVKRVLDLITSACGLLFLSPLFFVIALLVKLDSNGPVFFRQKRVARGGKLFAILKFRTMRNSSTNCGLGITMADDQRITNLGRHLRRLKLDELPQLFNVLTGDMSLVGPRPEVPKYVALYPPDLKTIVLSVRPGITDEASLEFRDESALLLSTEDPEKKYIIEILPRKLQLAAGYVAHRSLVGDLRILIRTVLRR